MDADGDLDMLLGPTTNAFNKGGAFNEVSEIANASCLLELKAAIDEWRFQQALPQLDERC